MNVLATPAACDPNQAWSCRVTWSLTENETAAQLAEVVLGKPAAIVGLLLLGWFARWILHRLIDRVVRRAEHGVLGPKTGRLSLGNVAAREQAEPVGAGAAAAAGSAAAARRGQRAATMGSLLKSTVTGVVYGIVGIMVLAEIGVNVAPLIASAGVVGVALGFGAQSLVKDFLSGIFMIIEDQYGVGDVIDAGEAVGTVEAVSLRVTRLRAQDGTVWYVRNGEILRIGNMSQNWARAVVDVGVGYGEDLVRVKRVLTEVAHGMWEDEDFQGIIIEEPEVTGVEMLAADSVNLRVLVKTAPMQQWAVARTLRERIKARFDHEGIEIPFQQRVIWHRDDRAGANDAGHGGPIDGPVDGPADGPSGAPQAKDVPKA